jgi:hypothetical protein
MINFHHRNCILNLTFGDFNTFFQQQVTYFSKLKKLDHFPSSCCCLYMNKCSVTIFSSYASLNICNFLSKYLSSVLCSALELYICGSPYAFVICNMGNCPCLETALMVNPSDMGVSFCHCFTFSVFGPTILSIHCQTLVCVFSHVVRD